MAYRLLTILALLVLGIVMNVIVAWTISQTAGNVWYGPGREPVMKGYHMPSTNTWWHVAWLDEIGMENIYSWKTDSNVSGLTGGQLFETDELPCWSRFRVSIEKGSTGNTPLHFLNEFARGWPMVALSMRLERDTTTYTFKSVNTIESPFRKKSQSWERRPEEFLPTGIIWRGFVVNSLVYAAIFALLITGTKRLRRWIRRTRGLCANCGYPIGVSRLCSECGHPVTPRPVLQSQD